MAIGKSSDFKIYEEQFQSGYIETDQQNVDALTGGSNGAITIKGDQLKGNYSQAAFFQTIATSTLIIRRDLTAVTAATDLAVAQGEMASVKCFRTIGPIAQTVGSWKHAGMDPQEISVVFGEQTAKAVLTEKLNSALAGSVAALYHQGSNVTVDATNQSTTTLTHGYLANALAKFGDQANRIVAWVMHSKPYYDLVGQSITDKITNVADVVIHTGIPAALGRPVIVTDSAALINTVATPDMYVTMGLSQDAIQITDSEVPQIEGQMVTGLLQLVYRLQGEYAYNLALKGFTWDISNGAANPTAAALASSTNWDPVAASVKDMLGVRIITT